MAHYWEVTLNPRRMVWGWQCLTCGDEEEGFRDDYDAAQNADEHWMRGKR